MLQSVSLCSITENALSPGAFALIHSSVRRVYFPFKSYVRPLGIDERFTSVFSRTCLAAPHVAELHLAFPPYRLGSALIQTHCSSVHHIQVDQPLDMKNISLLTQLPSLQYLSISLIPLPSPGPTLTFSSLATLVLSGPWSDLSTLLETLRLPSMRTLSVTAHEKGKTAAELATGTIQCFQTIASLHPSITSLTVSTATPVRPWNFGYTMPYIAVVKDRFEGQLIDIFHPLLSLNALS